MSSATSDGAKKSSPHPPAVPWAVTANCCGPFTASSTLSIWMALCFTLHPYVEASTTTPHPIPKGASITCIWRWAYMAVIKVRGGLRVGLNVKRTDVLTGRGREEESPPAPDPGCAQRKGHVRTQGEGSYLQATGRASSESYPYSISLLVLALELGKQTSTCASHPVCSMLLWQP